MGSPKQKEKGNGMKGMFLLSIFIVLFTGSCRDKSVSKQQVIDKYFQSLDNAGVRKFEISECNRDCTLDSGEITSIQLDGNLLKMKLNHWMNCIGAEHCSYVLNGNMLYLSLESKPRDYEVESNGDTSFIYVAQACNCFFNMSFELSGFNQVPDRVFINGQDVKNYLGAKFSKD